MLKEGLTHTSVLKVEKIHTAAAVGSGDMDVLASPLMLALMENAALLAVDQELPESSTTVGGYIESSHLKPTGVGAEVFATAELTEIDGRKLTFHVVAMQDDTVIGEGKHVRYIVDRQKFLAKV